MKKNYTEEDLIGTWKCADTLSGYQSSLVIAFNTSHELRYWFYQNQILTYEVTNTWQYSRNILTEQNDSGETLKGELQWMSNDYFILTILENGSPESKGVKRHYKRVLEKS